MNEPFVSLVRRMRAAQQQYLATRDWTQMHAATCLEREVDRALAHPWVPVQSELPIEIATTEGGDAA